jgi:anti-sigma-K factor RskA
LAITTSDEIFLREKRMKRLLKSKNFWRLVIIVVMSFVGGIAIFLIASS